MYHSTAVTANPAIVAEPVTVVSRTKQSEDVVRLEVELREAKLKQDLAISKVTSANEIAELKQKLDFQVQLADLNNKLLVAEAEKRVVEVQLTAEKQLTVAEVKAKETLLQTTTDLHSQFLTMSSQLNREAGAGSFAERLYKDNQTSVSANRADDIEYRNVSMKNEHDYKMKELEWRSDKK